MAQIKCRKCKSLFVTTNLGELCPKCVSAENETYRLVREYVKDNPGVSIGQVEEETGVPRNRIVKYLKEEKLEIANGTKSFLRCASCGETISSGVYCDACKRKNAEVPPLRREEPKRVPETKVKTRMHLTDYNDSNKS